MNTLAVDPDQVAVLWDEGTEWKDGDTVFRVERATRRHAVPPDSLWHGVRTVMRTLAHVHGDDAVRLVAWFEE
ncbi:hypothetical protein ACIBG4_08750 [Nonomuraea sp. NPDC050383]|uniref:hypothetical protein n=1 Tax=Nonomuraea sp. NPDC050383 TaxID=3364362 RepID=UPI00378D5695